MQQYIAFTKACKMCSFIGLAFTISTSHVRAGTYIARIISLEAAEILGGQMWKSDSFTTLADF